MHALVNVHVSTEVQADVCLEHEWLDCLLEARTGPVLVVFALVAAVHGAMACAAGRMHGVCMLCEDIRVRVFEQKPRGVGFKGSVRAYQ